MSDGMQPFRIEIPQADVEYLHDRLESARWPGKLPGTGWGHGVPAWVPERSGRRLAQRGPTGVPPRRGSTRTGQFITEIDGQRIHFLDFKSEQPGAKPLLITHGFPSSVAEFLHLIEPLVNPGSRAGLPRRRAVPARDTRSRPR